MPPRRRRTTSPAEPVVEGFFVARMAGEREAWRHHLTEGHAHGQEAFPGGDAENLGELPRHYEEDSTVLLARDPHTLFVFWSFSPETVRASFEGLDSPRAVLRVYEGELLVREESFALESKSFYVHGLAPGCTYRVEAHAVGSDGQSRLIGEPSNVVTLPPVGDSTQTQLRFLRVPPGVSLSQIEDMLRAGLLRVREETGEVEFISWERIPLPDSAEAMLQRTRTERLQRPEGLLEGLEGFDRASWASSPSGQGWSSR